MPDYNIPGALQSAGSFAQDASHRLSAEVADGNNMSTVEKLGRLGQVTLEGAAYAVPGALNAVEEDLKPKNWLKDAEMIGSAALFGIAMRTCLPESGMIAKTAGLVMGGSFAFDGLKHVGTAWSTVWQHSGDQAMNQAAQKMGDGLGEFAVDGGISMIAGGIAAKRTPELWNKLAPEQWNAIESWKAKNLADTTAVGSMLGKVGLGVKTRLSGLADTLDPPKQNARDLSPEQLQDTLTHVKQADLAYARSERMYKWGMRGSNGQAHGLDGTVDLLLSGVDPRTVAAAATDVSSRISTTDLSQPAAVHVQDTAGGAAAEATKPGNILGESGQGQRLGLLPKDMARKAGDAVTHSDATAPGTPPKNEAERLLNAKNMTLLADVTRNVLNSITDQEGMVMDAVNRTTGAAYVRTTAGIKPLSGYEIPRDAMLSLAQQVGTDPRAYAQVGDLFNRFGDAAVQSGTGDVSDVGAHVRRFNAYAAEHLARYEGNIIKQGIDPKVALQRKVVAPLGEATSDLEPIGTDSQGNPQYAHEGPHTVRAIYGPNGEIVWPIDLIKIPVREIGLRGVQTAPIDGHELTHDQFGRLGEFDPEVRNQKLGDAAAKALGADADKQVAVPNGGIDPRDVLLNNIERQAKAIKDPAQQEEFLAGALQLDQQSKVMKAGAVADKLLGPAGQQQVVKLQQGSIPLDMFIANLAAQADTRAPAEVLAEIKGQRDPAQTAQMISQNLDKMLGANGQMPIRLADRTRSTLKDVTMKVSDVSRNPEFDTYDQPLPKTMTMKDVLINLAKGWADETFADWGAASESGQSAASYFQALRKDGRLSSGTVMGQEMRSEDNPLGIEAHPVDKLRPRYQAALIRELATTGGQKDQMLLDWGDALDQYSRDAGQPGDIKLASMDAPGQAINITEPQMDAFIKELAHQQINTPLPRLQGRTLLDILPDLRKNFRINDELSTAWADAIKQGKTPDAVPFDADKIKMTHVYGAGQLTFLKLVADGVDPMQANEAINTFSDAFGNKVLEQGGAPTTSPLLKKLTLAPKLTLSRPQQLLAQPAAIALRAMPRATDFLSRNATAIGAGGGAYVVNDLIGMHQLNQEMLGHQ